MSTTSNGSKEAKGNNRIPNGRAVEAAPALRVAEDADAPRLRVIIADSEAIFRVGMSKIFATQADLEVVAPVRTWGFTREDSIDYAQRWGIPVSATKASPYSVDQNLWGRTVECGDLEDPWVKPPADVYELTVPKAAGGEAGTGHGLVALAAGIGMGLAAGLCGLGQGRATASATEALARNPGARAGILLLLTLGLAFME